MFLSSDHVIIRWEPFQAPEHHELSQPRTWRAMLFWTEDYEDLETDTLY